jgi:ornithine cyclodeaminase/alanine dehydrogenase-like protein (mu-crystallin family)
MKKSKGTLLLTRSELVSLMTIDEYIEGIENAFRMHAEGSTYGMDLIHGDTPGDVEFHIKADASQKYAEMMGRELSVGVKATTDLPAAISQSDMVVTCTPSKQPYLQKEFVKPGTFVATIGADSPDKRELEPALFGGTKIVVDIMEQCVRVGELHHSLEAGIVAREDVHGEIGEVIIGKKPGRESDKEIIIYDSTGTAIQDTAAAAICYEKALKSGKGTYVDFL